MFSQSEFKVYQFNVVNIYGKNISLSKYKGYVMLIVNIGQKSKYVT